MDSQNHNSKTTPIARSASLDPQRVAQRAYEIWQGEACPEGRSFHHWLTAEELVAAEYPVAKAPAASPMTKKGRSAQGGV